MSLSSPGRTRLKALALGALCALAALELCLRAIGGIETFRRRDGAIGARSGQYTILCYGNSHTAGAGAPPGQAYCDHLRDRLARESAGARQPIQVINRGVGNRNSAQVLAALRTDFPRFQPDLALIMTGEPNYWNKVGYGGFLDRAQRSQGSVMSRTTSRLYDLAYHLASFRLATILFERLREKAEARMHPRSLLFPETLLSDQLALGFKWFGVLNAERSNKYGKMTDEEAAEAFAALEDLASRPEGRFRGLYAVLGEFALYRAHDQQAAARWFRKSLALDPETFHLDVYAALDRFVQDSSAFRGAGSVSPELAEVLGLARKTYPGDSVFSALEQTAYDRTPGGIARAPARDQDLGFMARAVRAAPENEKAVVTLASLYQRRGRYLDMARILSEAIRHNPFSTNNMFALLNSGGSSDDPEVRKVVEETAAEFRRRFPRDLDRIPHGLGFGPEGSEDPASLEAWIASDIDEMAGFLKARGAKFLLQTYPPKRDRSSRPADEVILRLAEARGYPLSDTRAHFEGLFATGVERDSYYNQGLKNDDHLNGKGYRELADFLFESLSEQGLLPDASRAPAGPHDPRRRD